MAQDVTVEYFSNAEVEFYFNLKHHSFVRMGSSSDLPKYIDKKIEPLFSNRGHIVSDGKLLEFGVQSRDNKRSVAFPISGQFRILGLMIVSLDEFKKLASEELLFLSLIASHVSNYASFHLRKEILTVFQELDKASGLLMASKNSRNEYAQAVATCVSGRPEINYAVSILRLFDDARADRTLEAKSAAIEIDWSDYISFESTIDKKWVHVDVANGGEPLYVDRLTADERYVNNMWISKNGLKAAACVPIRAGKITYGSLTVYLSYEYKFYEYDYKFLYLISKHIANTLLLFDEREQLRHEKQEESNGATLFGIRYSTLIDELHAVKNELSHAGSLLADYSRHSDLDLLRTTLIEHHHSLESLLQTSSENDSVFFDLDELLNTLIRNFRSSAKENQILFNSEINLRGLVYGSKRAISTGLLNILKNSIKACLFSKKYKKEIAIYAYKMVDEFKIEWFAIDIQDNGIGIRHEFKDEIFNEDVSFFPDSSTGKGLFLAKSAIEEAGGEISVSSSVGTLTTFHVRLPVETE